MFFLDLDATATAVALAPATVERMVRDGSFPRPRQLSPRRVGWSVQELAQWSAERPIADNLPPPNTSRRPKAPVG
jgi:prophage regulatory protein